MGDNYDNTTFDDIQQLITDPNTVIGLSDAGAHVNMIFDAVAPTYQLTHWVRDRTRADINLFDLDKLNLQKLEVQHDLPAGGQRILQGAKGYLNTFVNGVKTRENDEDTGIRPGRLIRSS